MDNITYLSCPVAFLDQCGDFLHRHEIEHNLILSLSAQLFRRKEETGKCDARFFMLAGENGIDMAALQMPLHNLVLSRATTAQPPEALAEALAAQGMEFPGIVGPSGTAASFAEKWAQLKDRNYSEYMDQIIYSLDRVLFPAPVEGAFRFAKSTEAETLAKWIFAFAQDALPKFESVTLAEAQEKAEKMIAESRIAVWEVDGQPVAQAGFTRADDIARINLVYTPPEQRGHGYASAVVAHLSRYLLDHGFRRCCLYADARNPVSNSIYRKIGYEFVGRSSHYVL